MAKFPPGTPMTGQVIDTAVFGVFVRLDEIPDVKALLEIIHFGPLFTKPPGQNNFPEDYPQVGDQLKVRVLGWCLKPVDVRLTNLDHLEWY
ncbi:RNA binding S1 domain protein [Planctopirus limnophila DSM 3776]|uniref:RNA binding S1 domain protein n=1 Tax=Planctopirus limnophila (strain ATCC 43296 / DSM 3776 / IFAM 1008 / Mu 290) TaxID=521674 RepID=D5STW3_PLAL2|nr:S1 RNA-binding domain protein [Planctopirus limnophila]ADG66948.1 RNA binding S1 domain protein [Planctopirus limnophila DSM 3776]